MAWGRPGVSGSGSLAPQDRGVRRGSRGCSLSVWGPHGRTSQCLQPCKGGARASSLCCFGTPSSFPSCKGGHWEYSGGDCISGQGDPSSLQTIHPVLDQLPTRATTSVQQRKLRLVGQGWRRPEQWGETKNLKGLHGTEEERPHHGRKGRVVCLELLKNSCALGVLMA